MGREPGDLISGSSPSSSPLSPSRSVEALLTVEELREKMLRHQDDAQESQCVQNPSSSYRSSKVPMLKPQGYRGGQEPESPPEQAD